MRFAKVFVNKYPGLEDQIIISEGFKQKQLDFVLVKISLKFPQVTETSLTQAHLLSNILIVTGPSPSERTPSVPAVMVPVPRGSENSL